MSRTSAEIQAKRTEERMLRRQGGDGGYVPSMVKDTGDDDTDDDDDDTDDTDDDDDKGTGAGTPPPGEDAAALRAELARVRQELTAAQGRTAPVQRDLETYRQLTAELQRTVEAKDAELRAVGEVKKAPSMNPADYLSQEEIDDLDPTVLNTMVKLADAMVQRRTGTESIEVEVRKVLDKQQQRELREYREQALLSRDLSDIVQLKNDPRFIEWAEQDDNEVESTVTMLLNASTKPAIDKYARLLKRKVDSYKEFTKSPSVKGSASDAQTVLSAGMRRKQNSNVSAADMAAQLAKARKLARSTSAADRKKANEILTALGG